MIIQLRFLVLEVTEADFIYVDLHFRFHFLLFVNVLIPSHVHPLIGPQQHVLIPHQPHPSQAQCKVIAPHSPANRHSGQLTTRVQAVPHRQTRWPAPARPQFEPQNTPPFSLALYFQGWPSGRPRQLTQLLHPARSRADNADQPPAETSCHVATSKPCPAFRRGSVVTSRPPASAHPHYGSASARPGPPGRIGAPYPMLPCRPCLCTYFVSHQSGCRPLRLQPGDALDGLLHELGRASTYQMHMLCGAAKSRCRPAPSLHAVYLPAPHLGQRDT